MLTVLDISNHWSPTGGGVRRYQLEKCTALAGRQDVRHILVTPDRERETIRMGDGVVRESVPAPRVPGTGGYRYLLRSRALQEILKTYHPDVVVCGSPIVMPWLVRRALAASGVNAAVVGFWHADFPRTYTGRAFRRLHRRLEHTGERLGWWWAQRTYGRFDATIVASRDVARAMLNSGIQRLFYSPLGVNTTQFHPQRRRPDFVERVRAGDPRRRAILFPHRFCDEKGLPVMLRAYERIVARARAADRPEPALVFAGGGPHLPRVLKATRTFPHVHHLGYVSDPDELAAWFASCDIMMSLSSWETFGLSTAEAMASGLAVVSSDIGAAPELVRDGRAGRCVDGRDPEAVADALEKLLDDKDLSKFGRRGREFVEQLTWSATFERELAVYREVLNARRMGLTPAVDLLDAASLI